MPDLRRNTIVPAKVAALLQIPRLPQRQSPITQTVPLIPEIHQAAAPHAPYIGHRREINVWDSPDFVNALEAIGRKAPIIVDMLTSVCMAFPSISAVTDGYKVFVVVGVSGNWSKMATDLTVARIIQAGAIPIDTLAVISELQETWNRPDAAEFANLCADFPMPEYRCLFVA